MTTMWEQQWERLKRWHIRFDAINGGLEHNKPSDFLEDDMWAFFINCYHLKDWLKNDVASGVSAKDVEDYVNKSPNLSLCGDLANGSKHAVLKKAKVDPNTKLKNKLVQVTLHAGLGAQNPPTQIAVKYTLEAGGVTYDAFGLGTACMKEWAAFLKSKKLPTGVSTTF